VQGASLTVRDREVVALLGRNGMGKTSLIRSVMGLAAPQVRSGSVAWKGEVLTGLKSHEIARRKIALVPQGRRLFPSLSVVEHLTMIKPERATNGWTVARALELFPRLAERRNHRGNQLSGGERQMLAVARALMLDPELVLMDEPSEGLAPQIVTEVMATIRRLKEQGLSIVLVEQNAKLVFDVADDVVILNSGRMVVEASAAELKRSGVDLHQHLGIY